MFLYISDIANEVNKCIGNIGHRVQADAGCNTKSKACVYW